MPNRIHHLDALRSLCMLFGIFVHANTFFPDRPFPIIVVASDFFRMGTFFAISGFLVGLVGNKINAPTLIKRRSIALLVPLITVLVMLNPITNYLIYIRHNPWMSVGQFFLQGGWKLPGQGNLVWLLHLWFLIALFFFVLVHPALRWLLRVRGMPVLAEALLRVPAGVAVILIGAVVSIGVLGCRVIFELCLDPMVGGTHFEWVARASMMYLPYFALGMFLQQYRQVFTQFHKISFSCLIIAALGQWLSLRYLGDLPAGIQTAVQIIAQEFLTVILIAAFFRIAEMIVQKAQPLIDLLSGAMYTIYLLHFFLIYALGLVLSRFISNDISLYLAIVLLSTGIGLLIHQCIVLRIPILLLLLNGRRPSPAAD